MEEEEDEKGRGGRKAGSSVSSVSCCLSKSDLILWPDRSTSFPNTHNSTVLQVRPEFNSIKPCREKPRERLEKRKGLQRLRKYKHKKRKN